MQEVHGAYDAGIGGAGTSHNVLSATSFLNADVKRKSSSKRKPLPQGQVSLDDMIHQLHYGEGASKEAAFRHTVRLYDYQEQTLLELAKAEEDGHKNIMLELPTGCGKCLGKDTPILMYDGSIKAVQDVVEGDFLMGPDSNPRMVTSTCTGQEMLYRIVPTKGEAFVVNESHILSLKTTPTKKGEERNIVNLEVKDYLNLPKSQKHILKAWRTGVDFAPAEKGDLPLPAYFLGVWLGDGTSRNQNVTSPDPEIIDYLRGFASEMLLDFRDVSAPNRCSTWSSTNGRTGKSNPITDSLRSLGVLENKHIPHAYKTASREVRLELLAGIVDTDGFLRQGGYDMVFKQPRLANDVAFLCRSLGLAAYVHPCQKTCTNTGATGTYYRISVSGNVSIIPNKLTRKHAGERKQIKDVLVTGFKVEPVGVGDYYGFEITGDRLFMLGDFTVTHNTVVAGAFTEDKLKKGKRVLFLANRDILVGQAIDKFQTKLGIFPLREQARERAYLNFGVGGLDNNCVAGSVQTMHDLSRLDNWSPDSFDYILSDEAHRCTGNGWRGIRKHFKNAIHIGLSATPRAAIEAGLFQKSIKPITLAQAVERGFLVDCHIHRVKTNIDLSSIGISGKGAEADFNQKQLDEAIFKNTSMLATSIKKKIKGMKTAVFAPSVASAQGLAHALCDLGVSAETVSYKSPDPLGTIERFKNKEFQVICNCQILCEGWDDGDVECIVICNPSVNRDRYIQIVGRVLRLPETIEKRKGIVFDYAGVSDKHDLMHAVDVFIDGDLADPYNVELRRRARQLVDSGAETDGLKAVQQAKKEMAEAVAADPSKRRKAEEIHTEEKVIVFDPIYARVMGMPTQMPAKQAVQTPATQAQKDFISRASKNKLPVDGLTSEAATRVIIDLKERIKNKKCLPAQLNLLRLLNCPLEKRMTMTTAEANAWIDKAPKPDWMTRNK